MKKHHHKMRCYRKNGIFLMRLNKGKVKMFFETKPFYIQFSSVLQSNSLDENLKINFPMNSRIHYTTSLKYNYIIWNYSVSIAKRKHGSAKRRLISMISFCKRILRGKTFKLQFSRCLSLQNGFNTRGTSNTLGIIKV